MKYKVFVRTGNFGFDEYKVYSHHLAEGCLVLNLGRLKKSQGPDEMGIPLSGIISYHTGDLDE